MEITIHLEGATPLLMHNPQMVDPEFPVVRQIKTLTAKRKKTDSDFHEITKLEWIGGLYHVDGRVTQPSSKLRKCLIETGKITRQGKQVERAISMTALDVPLGYDGPDDIAELAADDKYYSRLSVGIGTKRVMRCRPQFSPWTLDVPAIFIEDAGLNFDEFERIVELAGKVEGIGDGRRIGYGRFVGSVSERS